MTSPAQPSLPSPDGDVFAPPTPAELVVAFLDSIDPEALEVEALKMLGGLGLGEPSIGASFLAALRAEAVAQ